MNNFWNWLYTEHFTKVFMKNCTMLNLYKNIWGIHFYHERYKIEKVIDRNVTFIPSTIANVSCNIDASHRVPWLATPCCNFCNHLTLKRHQRRCYCFNKVERTSHELIILDNMWLSWGNHRTVVFSFQY
jgi:hypothetical protein